MIESLILRFKDGEDPTIRRHKEVLEDQARKGMAQGVWWGWWKKTDAQEPFPDDLIRRADAEARSNGIIIGLVDRDGDQYCRAKCTAIRHAQGTALETLSAENTPAYYRYQKFPTWFYLTEIESLDKERWISLFGKVPSGVPTIYSSGGDRKLDVKVLDDTPSPHGFGLVHLSDLHFGSGHRFSQPGDPKSPDALPFLLDKVRERCLTPAGLVVSGDFLTRGETDDYGKALNFLRGASEFYELDPRRVILVPGNHDTPINASDPEDGYLKLGIFRQFLNEFYGEPTAVERVHDFCGEDGIHYVLGTVNSSLYRSQTTMDFGYVQEMACDEVLRALRHSAWFGCPFLTSLGGWR